MAHLPRWKQFRYKLTQRPVLVAGDLPLKTFFRQRVEREVFRLGLVDKLFLRLVGRIGTGLKRLAYTSRRGDGAQCYAMKTSPTVQRHHITYATGPYMSAARVLATTAKSFGLTTRIYTPLSWPSLQLVAGKPLRMSEGRGGGYWRWKPAILLDAMGRLHDGDALLYTDAAMHVIADPGPLFALTDAQPIVLFEHAGSDTYPPNPMHCWTKRDCFILLDADGPDFWNANQLLGGFIVLKVCDESRKFVRNWQLACMDDRILTDQPNECGKPNFPDFKAHRNDQAALTILAQKAGIVAHEDPSQFGVDFSSEPYGQTFYLHRQRTSAALAGIRSKLQLGTKLRRALRFVSGGR